MNRRDDWMTVGEVAEELKVPSARVYGLIRDPEGPLPAHRITPRTIRINRDELRTWLDTRKTPRTETDPML
jgi:excisionase family DNA binding protein